MNHRLWNPFLGRCVSTWSGMLQGEKATEKNEKRDGKDGTSNLRHPTQGKFSLKQPGFSLITVYIINLKSKDGKEGKVLNATKPANEEVPH